MKEKKHRLSITRLLLLGLPLIYGSSAYAAKAIDLSQQNISVMQSFVSSPTAAAINPVKMEEIKRSVDFKQTLHVRVQETYAGYPVFGADAVIHIPQGAKTAKGFTNALAAAGKNSSMDGTVYQDLQADLGHAPAMLNKAQANTAIQQAVNDYQQKVGGKPAIKDQQSKLIVFVDENNKAHWAYQVSFDAAPLKAGNLPAKPVYIIDAVSSQIYMHWDNIKTVGEEPKLEDAFAGGFGGNQKMGKLIYDGLADHLPQLAVKRDAATKTCYLQNADVTVKNCVESDWYGQCTKSVPFTVSCDVTDADHNNVYWNGEADAVNGGYSPSNDALFNGQVIKDLYQKWYDMPVLETDGEPMMLGMVVHLPMDNAYWDGQAMHFGDGKTIFYPLTSLGVSAHEISHGFTEQHSNLVYSGQSGGMNEAFSDMAAQAAEFYAYGKNSWQIGPEIFKSADEALRYMDQPSKDCNGSKPGNGCSIDNASQYKSGIDVHYSSGVYNRFFYLLGSSEGWGTKKAFDVMVQANNHYWTSSTNFAKGACGVLKAAKDYSYDQAAIVEAFKTVGIKTDKCKV